jgi:CheY-like chemotaxis protein
MFSALLVDRDADTRLLYAEYLRQSAYEVEEAEDGREALAKAIARVPSVIVSETRLPGMSGYDLCRVLRSDLSTEFVPIVVVTGDAGPSDLKRAEDAGADTVLVKPCLPDRLGVEIQRLLARSADLHGAPRRLTSGSARTSRSRTSSSAAQTRAVSTSASAAFTIDV